MHRLITQRGSTAARQCPAGQAVRSKACGVIERLAGISTTSAACQPEEGEETQGQEEPAPRKRSRKPTRRQLGSYATVEDEFEDEMSSEALTWPDNRPVYDIPSQAEFLVAPVTTLSPDDPVVQMLKAGSNAEANAYLREHAPGLEGLLALGPDAEEEADAAAAAAMDDDILEWQVRATMHTGPTLAAHPADKKAVCRVYLASLQRTQSLSADAAKYIALLCGPRYDPGSGRITLTSEKFSDREANRRDIMTLLYSLIQEAHSRYPTGNRIRSEEKEAAAG